MFLIEDLNDDREAGSAVQLKVKRKLGFSGKYIQESERLIVEVRYVACGCEK